MEDFIKKQRHLDSRQMSLFLRLAALGPLNIFQKHTDNMKHNYSVNSARQQGIILNMAKSFVTSSKIQQR